MLVVHLYILGLELLPRVLHEAGLGAVFEHRRRRLSPRRSRVLRGGGGAGAGGGLGRSLGLEESEIEEHELQ